MPNLTSLAFALGFLADNGRELVVFEHAVRYIERFKERGLIMTLVKQEANHVILWNYDSDKNS